MKQIRTIFLFLFLACIMPVVTSCGGSSDDEKELEVLTETTTGADLHFEGGCALFGLNKDDYKNIDAEIDSDQNLVLYTFIKKSDNSVFVGLYDTSAKKVVFKDEQLNINLTETVQYYEEKYIRNLISADFDYIEIENGNAMCLNMRYAASEGHDSIRKIIRPVLYLNNGSKNTKIVLPLAKYTGLYKWYKNSVIVRNDDSAMCYTDDGNKLYSFKFATNNEPNNNYALSYTDYLKIQYDIPVHQCNVTRNNLEKGDVVWGSHIKCLENTSDKAKVSYSVEKGNPEWKITIKAVEEDGTTSSAVVIVNIETGEAKVQ